MVEFLLSKGANPNKASKYGSTPLNWASREGHTQVVKALLAAPGIDVNKADKDGRTPLQWASWERHTVVVKLLLAAPGIDVNKADKDGETPLYWASCKGYTEVVMALLSHEDIDVNKASNSGKTPFDIATKRSIKKMLREKMGLAIPYRNMNNQEKKEYKPLLLKRLLVKKRNNKNFVDPITRINYNMRTLEPVNNNEKSLTRVGLIIDNNNKPIRLVNYNSINNFRRRTGDPIIRGVLHKDWSLIPFNKEELNKAYKGLGRVSAMAKSARTRKNLSTLRSSTSIRHRFDKAKAINRIKRNEKKTETIAKLYRNKREIEKTIRSLM
jgi:hypothetical protein